VLPPQALLQQQMPSSPVDITAYRNPSNGAVVSADLAPICDPTTRDIKASGDSTTASPQDGFITVTPSESEVSTADSNLRKPGFQPASKAPLAVHMQARDSSLPTPAKAKAKPKPSQYGTGPASESFTVPSNGFDSYDSTVASPVNRDVPAVNSFEAATDALAAEALDATDGAFPSVDDAIEAANFGIGVDANIVECTVKSARAVTSGGGPGAQIVMETSLGTPLGALQASTVSPSVFGSARQPDAPALESGPRPPAVSTLRREPHPFLTTENAKAYAQDPRMEGLTIDIDYEYPSEIQHLPWNVFLTPRERGASLQDEHLAAHYAAKQLRDGELIRRVCDDWNYNSANSYTPNDLRHGPITVWPQGRVTPAMRASYGDRARFWSKQVRLVADVPMEFRSFDDDAAV